MGWFSGLFIAVKLQVRREWGSRTAIAMNGIGICLWVCPNSCLLSWWCYLIISSSATPFSFLPSIFLSIKVFSKGSTPIRWPKYWNFSISPSNEYSGLISFRIDWFDLPTVQGTVKSLLQHQSWKVSFLQHSAFLIIHMGLWYIPTSTVASLPFSSFQFNPRHLFLKTVQFSSVQSLSHVQLFVTPWIAARQASLSITNSRSSLKLTSIEPVMPSSHLILCCTLLLLPPIPPSIRVFSNESTFRMRWPKY